MATNSRTSARPQDPGPTVICECITNFLQDLLEQLEVVATHALALAKLDDRAARRLRKSDWNASLSTLKTSIYPYGLPSVDDLCDLIGVTWPALLELAFYSRVVCLYKLLRLIDITIPVHEPDCAWNSLSNLFNPN